MSRASFVTPVYLYSSIKAGSGKASLVANHAIYLNNSGQSVAVIDLDKSKPAKLKNCFAQSINLQTYEDLGSIVNAKDSRYQRTFYFTETDKISFFPGYALAGPNALFQDASLRDFFLQARATFDVVLVNFPSGDRFSIQVSEIIAQQHLWHGSKPFSLIVSTSELSSLLLLDGITRKAPALGFQLRENALIIFNRVPQTLDEQKLSDNCLNISELKRLFSSDHLFFIINNEELPHQRNIASPIVLNPDSLLYQCFSRLNRLLTASKLEYSLFEEIDESGYKPTLDGSFLERLAPYLEEIRSATATRLFVKPEEIMVFLEESPDSYRIRVRFTGQRQKTLGIREKLKGFRQKPGSGTIAPELFNFKDISIAEKKAASITRIICSKPRSKSIYRFNDNFAGQTDFKLCSEMDFSPEKHHYPSPIIFVHEHIFTGLPTLSQILGFSKAKFQKYHFWNNDSFLKIPGVTHFFIPPEFPFCHSLDCVKNDQDFLNLLINNEFYLSHEIKLAQIYQFNELSFGITDSIPDLFSRTQPQIFKNERRFNMPKEWNFKKVRIEKEPCVYELLALETQPEEFSLIEHLSPYIFNPELPKILPLNETVKLLEEGKNEIDLEDLFNFSPFPLKTDHYPVLEAQKRFETIEPDYDLSVSTIPDQFKLKTSIFNDLQSLDIMFNQDRNIRPSPQSFTFYSDKPHIHFKIRPKQLKNKYLNLDSVLLDHSISVNFTKQLPFNLFLPDSKSFSQSRISFKTIFPTPYSEAKDDTILPEKLSLQDCEIMNLFSNFLASFLKLPMHLEKSRSSFEWDILQIRLISEYDPDFLQPQFVKSCNQNASIKATMSPEKATIIKINVSDLKSESSVKSLILNSKLSKKKLKSNLLKPNSIPRATCFKQKNEEEVQFKVTKQSLFSSRFSDFEKPASNISYLSNKAKVKRLHFEKLTQFFPLILHCLANHDVQPKFYKNTKIKSLPFSEPSSFALSDNKNLLSVANAIFCSALNHSEIILSSKLPIRLKVFETPGISTDLTRINTRNISNSKSQLIQSKQSEPQREFIKTSAKIADFSARTNIELPCYPTIFPGDYFAQKTLVPCLKYQITVNDVFAELYENLRRNLNRQMCENISLKLKPMQTKPINLEFTANDFHLQVSQDPKFVRRLLSGPEKLYLKINRNLFEIIDPKLKDLFKLFRATRKKYKSVSENLKST
jgi:MinD-like ATPase involved in chromosome partitioning or flagellar assembly